MTRGTLTVTIAPSKRSLGTVIVNVEVADIEKVMRDLRDLAPGVQSADILFRILRRL